MIKMYIGLHVKYPLFMADFDGTRIFWTDFRKILKFKISWKSVQWGPSVPYGRTDRQRDMTKLIVVCRNFANAPKKTVSFIKYRVFMLHREVIYFYSSKKSILYGRRA